MKKIATFVKLLTFKEVTFYSLVLEEDGDVSLGEQFFEAYQDHPHYELLFEWIQRVGNLEGALEHLFRQEGFKDGSAEALPPPRNFTRKDCELRLYCLRMRPTTVILFNGGIKTTQKAQNCPNVKGHHALANQLGKAIWKAFENGDIRFDEDDIMDIDDDFELEY